MSIMNIKHISFVLLVVLSLVGCKQKTPLQKEIEGLQKMLPLHMSFGDITEVYFDDNCLTIISDVDESQLDLSSISQNESSLKQNLLSLITLARSNETTLNDSMYKMMAMVVDEECSMKMIYRGKNSREEVPIVVTQEEIQAATNSSASASDVSFEYIDRYISDYKNKLPEQCEEGMFLVDIYKDNQYMYMIVSCDEELYSIEAIEQGINSGGLDGLVSEMRTEDNKFEAVCRLLKQSSLGLIIRYMGKQSKEYADLVTESDQL